MCVRKDVQKINAEKPEFLQIHFRSRRSSKSQSRSSNNNNNNRNFTFYLHNQCGWSLGLLVFHFEVIFMMEQKRKKQQSQQDKNQQYQLTEIIYAYRHTLTYICNMHAT